MNELDKMIEDPYVIEGTNPPVLKNKLLLTDHDALNKVQKQICFQKLCELRLDPIKAFQEEGLLTEDEITFGAEHLRRIHYYLFHDIFPFAGEYRTIDIIAKGRPPAPSDYTFYFMSHDNIKMELEMTLSIMARTIVNKKFKDKDDYAKWLANYYRSMINIHPFRDGNGRATKEYMSEFVEHANKFLDLDPVEILWENMSPEEWSNITYMETMDPNYLDNEMKRCLVYKEPKKIK